MEEGKEVWKKEKVGEGDQGGRKKDGDRSVYKTATSGICGWIKD
jgi:hypothetical protein